ncbi:MAG: tripartite tricarboxylate transporter substrate-binding protein [Proteobacteria bacterium]|nr:tripartite tricarboxylate transporter substrate-binding protein [Pseudomonadota bacterium]
MQTITHNRGVRIAALLAACAIFAPATASADPVADFYKGRTITFINPFGASGSYGQMLRLLAKHMPGHIPGRPNGVTQFMPGGGGIKMTNYLYNIAAKDGSIVGLMYDNMPSAQVLRPDRGVKFDARKFGALGSFNRGEVGVLALWKKTGIASISEAKKKLGSLGSTGTGSAQYMVPNVVNKVLGTKFRLVPGYKSTGELFLAIEQGELSGVFTNYVTILQSRPEWIRDDRFYWLAQLGSERLPELKDVPLLDEIAATKEDKAVFTFLAKSRVPGKIVITPPGVPGDRLAALRAAFADTFRDKAFRAEVTKAGQTMEPRSWQDAASVIAETVETPAPVVKRVRDLIRPKK